MRHVPLTAPCGKGVVARAPQGHDLESMCLEELSETSGREKHLMRPRLQVIRLATMHGQRIADPKPDSGKICRRKHLPATECGKDVVPTAGVLGAHDRESARLQQPKDLGSEQVNVWHMLDDLIRMNHIKRIGSQGQHPSKICDHDVHAATTRNRGTFFDDFNTMNAISRRDGRKCQRPITIVTTQIEQSAAISREIRQDLLSIEIHCCIEQMNKPSLQHDFTFFTPSALIPTDNALLSRFLAVFSASITASIPNGSPLFAQIDLRSLPTHTSPA